MASDVGEIVQRSIAIRNSSGSAVDADTLPTYTVTLPNGSAGTAPAVAHGTVGEYFVLYPTTTPGPHQDTWTATVGGIVQIFGPDTFRVRGSTAAPLFGLAEARYILGLGMDVSRDERVRDTLDAATADVERATGKTYRRTTVTSEAHYAPRGTLRFAVLRKSPLISVTAVVDAGVTLAASAYEVDLNAGVIYPMSGRFAGSVEMSYVAGSLVPDDDTLAVVRLGLQHKWAQQAGASGVPRRSTGVDPITIEYERALARLGRRGAFA